MTDPPLRIPIADPHAVFAAHRQELLETVASVLEGGWYVLGPEVTAFEAEFATYVGSRDGIGVASGTDAIELALRGCGIGPGDLVFTVANTAVATVAAIVSAGAIPVLVEVDPGTLTMDPQHLEHAILETRRHPDVAGNSEPKAVVAVHLYGHPVDMDGICSVVDEHGLTLIEDCAQAHGARWLNRPVGSFGRAACFSFYPTKNLGAFGDAGMVVTSDSEVAERVRLLRQYGWRERYVSETHGTNSRLDELQAALLRRMLPHLDEANEQRRRTAAAYRELIAIDDLVPLHLSPKAEAVFHQFVVRTTHRDELQQHLRSRGVGTSVLYPVPIHDQGAYKDVAVVCSEMTITERSAREILSLPIGPHVGPDQVKEVVAAINSFQSP